MGAAGQSGDYVETSPGPGSMPRSNRRRSAGAAAPGRALLGDHPLIYCRPTLAETTHGSGRSVRRLRQDFAGSRIHASAKQTPVRSLIAGRLWPRPTLSSTGLRRSCWSQSRPNRRRSTGATAVRSGSCGVQTDAGRLTHCWRIDCWRTLTVWLRDLTAVVYGGLPSLFGDQSPTSVKQTLLLYCRPTLAETHPQSSTGLPRSHGHSLGQTDAGRPGLPPRDQVRASVNQTPVDRGCRSRASSS